MSCWYRLHVAGSAEIIVEFLADITTAVLRKHYVSVRIDIIRVVKAQFHHSRNHVFQSVRPYERTSFGYLLYGKECRILFYFVAAEVMLLDQ